MNRDEFTQLPLAVALGIMWETNPAMRDELHKLEAPKPALSPKYDRRLYRSGGYQWASETALDSLKWYYERAVKSAKDGGQYAENNAKEEKALKYWLDFRMQDPTSAVRTTRGDDLVKAEAPSRDPQIHAKDARRDNSRNELTLPANVAEEDVPF